MLRYFIIHKPCNMVSQFISPDEKVLLGDLGFDFPPGTHAIGRLDDKSEGLLILTTDKTLTHRLLHPSFKHRRSYLVYVQRTVVAETLEVLSKGVDILLKKRGTYTTMPCTVTFAEEPLHIPGANPGFIEYTPHSWLRFELAEGKNRQIRKMCEAVNHRCRRLIRVAIEDLELGNLKAGEVREMEKEEIYRLLKITTDQPLAHGDNGNGGAEHQAADPE